MRILKIIIVPLLLLVLSVSTISTNAYGKKQDLLDQETQDRIRESYGLDKPATSSDPFLNHWISGDWGMSSPSALILELATAPIHPMSFVIRNLACLMIY